MSLNRFHEWPCFRTDKKKTVKSSVQRTETAVEKLSREREEIEREKEGERDRGGEREEEREEERDGMFQNR